MVYDLIVVGNGLAAQVFLFELFKYNRENAKKSQNYSVAQIFSEDIAPACSLRTTATVSLSGIEEGVSHLGDNLRESFSLFEDFVVNFKPDGVEKVKQVITYSNEIERDKIRRRYKVLYPLTAPLFNQEMNGTELDSYIIDPFLYADWFNKMIALNNVVLKKSFIKNFTTEINGIVACELLNDEKISAKKIVFCTGAYSKIFSEFYSPTKDFRATQVISGSYLERTIDFNLPSIYLTIDGHNLIYRSIDKKLIIGSSTEKGAFYVSNDAKLKSLLELFKSHLKIDLGSLNQFDSKVGLRHKGAKRWPIARALNDLKSIYMINGFYKNGFTFSHFTAKKIVKEIFSS